MSREQDDIKRALKGHLAEYLRHIGVDTRKTFKCLNPAHKDSHPSMSYDKSREKVHCFSCGVDYDTIDLIQAKEGLEYGEALKRGCQLFGIPYKTEQNYHKTERKLENKGTQMTEKTEEKKELDFTRDYEKWTAELDKAGEYLSSRGIDIELARKYHLGYVENWKSTVNGAYCSKGLVIPTSRSSFTVRDLTKDTKEKMKYKQGGKDASIFNLKALSQYSGNGKPVYIVEGELDALSVIQMGYQAIGLAGKNNGRKLTSFLQENKIDTSFIIALDNEAEEEKKKGIEKDAEELKEALSQLGYKTLIYQPYGDCKDANECLQKAMKDEDGGSFRADLDYGETLMLQEADAEIEEYDRGDTCHLLEMMEKMSDEYQRVVPTGFKELDKVLDGGLYEGLTIIGAMSSQGKTTFTLQVADQIAKSGTDVLFFSLEQGAYELIAKSLSRYTFLTSMREVRSWKNALTERNIRIKKNREESFQKYPAQKTTYDTACDQYIGDMNGGRLRIVEKDTCTLEDIEKAIEKHLRTKGRTPVVVVDYLQILDPSKGWERMGDKAILDHNVKGLRVLAKKYHTSVICISSFSRNNYTNGVSIESCNGSGNIEYDADLLLGLQLKGIFADKMDTKGSEKAQKSNTHSSIDDAMGKIPRQMELVLLKQRGGEAKAKIDYKFYSPFNTFTEGERTDQSTKVVEK